MFLVFLGCLWMTSPVDSSVPAPVFTPTPEEKRAFVEQYTSPSASETARKKIGYHFINEKLHYTLSFFPFIHAADADFTFSKDSEVKNGYIAELNAHTTGIIKFFTAQRRGRFISHMVMAEDGKRLKSVRFEKIMQDGGKQTKRVETEFDYAKNLITWKTWKGTELSDEGSSAMTENTICDDPLSAFYNFRYGVYGNIEKGKPIDIAAVPTKREAKLELQVASEEETQKENNVNTRKSQREYLVRVLMDKEMFEQKKGNIELWFSKDFVPLECVVKGVLFFGDIRGVLRPNDQQGG